MEIRLPQYGMGMQEGTVVAWRCREGDAVEEGDVLAEIEAAKTEVELVAPRSGVLRQILVPEGQTVPVHEPLAVLAPSADSDRGQPSGAEVPVGAEPRPVEEAPLVEEGSTSASSPRQRLGGPVGNVTPRARRLARELGVDLAALSGTGPQGRITEDDVRSAAGEKGPDTGHAAVIPLRGTRRMIADRMHDSLHSMAQLTLVTTIDITDLVAHRDGLPDSDRPGYTDLVVKAVAIALRDHPGLNATLDGHEIRLLPDIHIGVATAVDDGLVVPVIRDVNRKTLREIAAKSAELVKRVRDGEYETDDIFGSTFTVTSLGGYGIDAFTPIINPPEAAILGVGRIVDQPARDGDDLVWRKSITLSLTIDHRIVDGAPGAAFLQAVGDVLTTLGVLDR
jgi:pyruvate dehydrogenase E2 component (dihydrolipoamide acetyltransferase)